MNDDEIIASLAKSKTVAKRLAKKATAPQVERAIEHLQLALQDAKKREQEKESKRKEASLKKLSAMVSELGLDPEDLAKLTGGTVGKKRKAAAKNKRGPKSGKKVAPKYQITHEGQTIQWTGRGRMPIVFREFLDQGGNLDQCLIDASS